MAEPPETDREKQQRAIGALIWKDPERILDHAAKLRGTGALLECRLRGGSMGAAIPAGSRLRIAVGSTEPVRVGDVVAFVRDDGICVHRVAHRSGELLVTQGDACAYPDPPVDASRVVGPVREYLAGGEWKPVVAPRAEDRARSASGRGLLRLVTGLMKIDVRIARLAARALRLRGEGPAIAEGNEK
ncbi:hypothetical protein BWI17_01565 [Betaproteobacteria bacterium GR16-43]|nr:hypothetical protein BWI17_01565 [Betaproteobacteria bacterium GR16-43]